MPDRMRFTHMFANVCVLIISICLMSSCGKESTNTSYMISFGWKNLTQSREIQDPEIREKYEQILTDIYNLKPTTDAYWQVWISSSKYKTEDRKAEETYNSHLADVMQIEASCKKIIDNLENRDNSSFSATVEYTLKRWDVYENTELQNYSFELRYN